MPDYGDELYQIYLEYYNWLKELRTSILTRRYCKALIIGKYRDSKIILNTQIGMNKVFDDYCLGQ